MAARDQLDGATVAALLDTDLLVEQEKPGVQDRGGEVAPAPPAATPRPQSKAKGAPVVIPAKSHTKSLLPGSAEHAAATGLPATVAQINAARLAQVVNLHIAGYSLAEIGASIGASGDEVDRMLQQDAARYVRTQPALRTYVRNWVSERYTQLLDAVWEDATDKNSRAKLESQDRALRILDKMAKLHGAEAPTQSEITVEAAPEAVEKLVEALAKAQGLGYDMNVFDGEVLDAEVVHTATIESAERTVVSGNAVEQPQPEDGEGLV